MPPTSSVFSIAYLIKSINLASKQPHLSDYVLNYRQISFSLTFRHELILQFADRYHLVPNRFHLHFGNVATETSPSENQSLFQLK